MKGRILLVVKLSAESRAEVLVAMISHLSELERALAEMMPNDKSERRALEQSIAELKQIIGAGRC